LISAFNALISAALFIPIALIPGEYSGNIAEGLFYLSFFILLCITWSHYIIMNVLVFKNNIVILGEKKIITRIIQLFFAVVFSFAVVFYYLFLFTNNEAFSGMHHIASAYDMKRMDNFDKLSLVPPLNTVIDCVYYSVVTITTLGYGDIEPRTNIAKIISMIEVLSGLIIVVLSLGSVVGGNKSNTG
jgi:hypothetical protein